MALIPPFFLDCVVAIGYVDDNTTRWAASGFLYGHRMGGDEKRPRYVVYLVTNRHVVEDHDQVVIRCNPSERGAAREYLLDLCPGGRPIWCSPRRADVAVVALDYGALRRRRMQVSFFASDRHAALRARLHQLGVSEGDFAYVLGFPMGLVGAQRNAVVARGGSIARIRDALHGPLHEFLLDALVYPGNSGGPVILKPEICAIEGTVAHPQAWLIGVVSSYVAYEEVAVSQQTDRPRLVFEENSGLANVQLLDAVESAIAQHLETALPRRAWAAGRRRVPGRVA